MRHDFTSLRLLLLPLLFSIAGAASAQAWAWDDGTVPFVVTPREIVERMLRIVDIPKAALFPVVLVLCVIGAYALSNTMSNVYILLVFGLVGYGMVKLGLPLAPFILGVILGDQIEINLIRSIMTDPDPWLFVTRPISGAMLAMSVGSVALALWQHRRQQKRLAAGGGEDADF